MIQLYNDILKHFHNDVMTLPYSEERTQMILVHIQLMQTLEQLIVSG